MASMTRDGFGISWWPGPGLALASALLFGISTPLAKLLLGETSPLLLAGLLYLGSGAGLAVMTLVARIRGRSRAEAPLRAADLPWLAAVVVFGGIVGPALLMRGLAVSPAAAASLLLNTEALATLAIAWLVFQENVDRRVFLGAMAIVAGGVLLSFPAAGPGTAGSGWGSLFIVLACLAWGIDNNLTRKLSAADPVQLAMVKGLAAGAVNVGLALSQGAALPSPALVLGAATIGFLGYGVSLVLFVVALRHLGTARTGAYFSTAPFIGAAVAMPLFGEPMTVGLAAAGALMALGVYLHLSESHEHEHVHEALEHEHRHVHDAHHRHAHEPEDPAGEPHSHRHRHEPMVHKHPHYPDMHHRHRHAV